MDTRSHRMTSSGTFDCPHPGCNASYRRREHLARHLTQHTQPQSFGCPICNRTFRRNDTLRRHMRRAHAADKLPSQTRRACSQCRSLKIRCEGGKPCRECIRRRTLCSLDGPVLPSRRDSPRRVPNSVAESLPAASPLPERRDEHFVDLYFQRFHPHWPFVHRGSFNLRHETPLLAQSMMIIGLWASGEQRSQRAALDLHRTLDSAIHQQREVWDASDAEDACSACSWPIPTYQAILLHIIFAIMHKGGSSMGFDLKLSLPPADIELLDSLVRSCKRLGMFYYPNVLARHRMDSLATFTWVSIEEVKRFDVALYKVYKLLSREETRPSTAVETSREDLSAIDLQFPMPTNNRLWNAKDRDEWMSSIDLTDFCRLDDMRESEWISNSAELVELVD